MNQSNELTRDVVVEHADPRSLALALSSLQRAGILSQENRMAVIVYPDSRILDLALLRLQEVGILTQENFNAVIAHINPSILGYALARIQEARMLTEVNRGAIIAHANLDILAPALSNLQQAGILTQANFNTVIDHLNPIDLVSAFSDLQRAGILNQENRTEVITYPNLRNLVSALSNLQRAGILNQVNFDEFITRPNPRDLVSVFSALRYAGMLSQVNFDALIAHANPHDLTDAFSSLHRARICTQANVDALLDEANAPLLTVEARRHVWNRIPTHLLTQDNFARLLTAARAENPQQHIQQVTHQILGIVPVGAAAAQAFNPRQSTHTASVHRSVSDSASRLIESYGSDLNVEVKIKELKAFVHRLPQSLKNDAAKRCIDRSTAADYSFTDPSSGVSTRQLLALTYTAIHDKDKCSAPLEVAMSLLVEALYEIQRGYNINEEGDDNGDSRDLPICTSGAFNKIIEKLNGVYDDVEIKFITHQVATLKFQRLAAQHAREHLKSLATSAVTTSDYQKVKALLDGIKESKSLAPIWASIKEGIKIKLWDEFNDAYNGNRDHHQFNALIDHGEYLAAPDVSSTEAVLMATPGYQDWCYEQERRSLRQQQFLFRFEHNCLWTNKDSSPQSQKAFDRKFGIVPYSP